MKFKSCPFCGSDKVKLGHEEVSSYSSSVFWHFVVCTECWCEGKYDLGESGAAENWNHRVYPPEVQAVIEAAKLVVLQQSVFNGVLDAVEKLADALDNLEESEAQK